MINRTIIIYTDNLTNDTFNFHFHFITINLITLDLTKKIV